MKVNINDEIIIEGSKNKSLPRIRSKATDVSNPISIGILFFLSSKNPITLTKNKATEAKSIPVRFTGKILPTNAPVMQENIQVIYRVINI